MFITIDDTKIFATAFGAKSHQPLLAFGGWIGSWEDWVETLSLLSETRRVLAYDHRGSGITISPTESITFDRLIDDVFVVMDAFGVEKCVLAAMSMGSAVALGAALRYPERVSGLILANSFDLRGRSADGKDMFLLGLQHNYPHTLDTFVNLCVPESDSEVIKHWGRHILNRASQEAAISLYQISKTIDLHNALPNVTQPTLLIHGDADKIAPLESAKWLAETLPNVTLKIINGAGHVAILTFPQIVASAINDFTAQHGL